MQWKRISEDSINNLPLRYTACHFEVKQSDPQPNSWLISDRITVSEANRIDITVDYRIRGCASLANNGGYYCNNESFALYVSQSDQFIADPSKYPNPINNAAAYEKVEEISQPINSRTLVTINSLVKGRYILLAFHNSGACTILFSVKVSYNVCPAEKALSDSLVTLPRTVAPANDSEPIRVKGNCKQDAVQVSGNLHMQCDSHGEWNISAFEGRCVCKEDMQNVKGNCKGAFHSVFKHFSRLRWNTLAAVIDILSFLGVVITPKLFLRRVPKRKIS